MTSLRLVSWCWSQEGNVKLNVDGSSWGNFGQAGFGGLLRGVDGRWIVRFKGSVGFVDNLLPELMAICMGLRLHGKEPSGMCRANWTRWKPLDSFQLMRRIIVICLLSRRSRIGCTRIGESRYLMSIGKLHREANACANFLAKEGVTKGEFLCVLQDPPVGILHLLRVDYMGTVFVRPYLFSLFF